MNRRTVKRGAHREEEVVFLGAWIPAALMERIDQFVEHEDSDRSKLLRRALEEKVSKQEAA